MYTCYIQSFKILSNFCSWAGWFKCYLVENPRRHIFAWCGSHKAEAVSNCFSHLFVCCFTSLSINPLMPTVPFVRPWQTVQTQIRCRSTWHLIRVYTVCLQNGWVRVLRPFNSIQSFETMEGWTWKALCNEAPFMFGKNLASSGIRTRVLVIRVCLQQFLFEID